MARVLRPLYCIALLFSLRAVVSARVHRVYTGGQWETVHATVYGSNHASGTMASGEASQSSPLQFGSTIPGFMNGIFQIPTAQANTAPPNLDEQHDTVAKSQWHQATQLHRPRNSHILDIAAPIVSFLVFLGCCYCCWRMCTNNNTEEVADPEQEVELDVVPVGAGPAVVVGLDPNMIDLFPLLPFMIDGPVGFGGSECQICLEQFVDGENVRILPTCRHIFHDHCIKRGWPAEQNALFVATSI